MRSFLRGDLHRAAIEAENPLEILLLLGWHHAARAQRGDARRQLRDRAW